MAHPAIAPQVHEALNTHRYFTTQITFDGKLRDFVAQPFHIGLGKLFNPDCTPDTSSVTNLLRAGAADTVNRGQRDFSVLVVGNVYPCDAGHAFTPKC